jgi:hypothetical protein
MIHSEQIDIINRLVPTIIVEKTSGKIETTEVVKDKNGFKNINNSVDYNLKKIKESIFKTVLLDLEQSSNIQKIRFLKLNFFQKIFVNKYKKLNSKIESMKSDTSWMIIPKCSLTLSKLNGFRMSTQDNICIGTIDDINIFLNPICNSTKILFGNYNSFKLVINSNMEEYQIIENNKIKILELI